MDRTSKLFIASIATIIITIIVLVITCILAGGGSLSIFPTFCGLVPFILFCVGIMTFSFIYIFLDKGVEGLSATFTNATLTCKNGHKCRVYVNYSGDGWWYDPEKGGYVYHIGGEPAITPKTCPECGAHWEVPHKHNQGKSKPSARRP